ncbi:MAG TPA: prepilin-type N-terminal cleavage/methylation domain-containing protein [Tepidisphaeraceae bacterium]|nr:prepilin-type N-terminal cleavage/methylation domain-containing protein [Tepidisphaeraceae bacterium]
MRNCNSRRAFSLVELLVVMFIILILVAILVPVISSARRSAKVAVCGSNLRQIGQGVHSYWSEHRRLPVAGTMPAPFENPNWPFAPIYDALASYVSLDSGIYRCPEDGGQVFDRCVAASPAERGISYIYVARSKEWEVKDKVLRTETDQVMWDYAGDSLHGLVAPFHKRGGGNILYRDGSVEFKPG